VLRETGMLPPDASAEYGREYAPGTRIDHRSG
jgi:hypothetical protein